MISRHYVRHLVIQALYSWHVGDNAPKDVIQTLLKPNLKDEKELLRFGEKLFLKTIDKFDDYEEEIAIQLKNWDVKRLAMLDKIILKMALTELVSFEDIPVKVSINEAIEIAKDLSTEQSGKFVNGILDSIRIKWEDDGTVKKTGRGLVNKTVGSGT